MCKIGNYLACVVLCVFMKLLAFAQKLQTSFENYKAEQNAEKKEQLEDKVTGFIDTLVNFVNGDTNIGDLNIPKVITRAEKKTMHSPSKDLDVSIDRSSPSYKVISTFKNVLDAIASSKDKKTQRQITTKRMVNIVNSLNKEGLLKKDIKELIGATPSILSKRDVYSESGDKINQIYDSVDKNGGSESNIDLSGPDIQYCFKHIFDKLKSYFLRYKNLDQAALMGRMNSVPLFEKNIKALIFLVDIINNQSENSKM